MTRKQQQGYIKLKKAMGLLIEAWEEIGLNVQSPEEYKTLKKNYNKLKEQING